MTRIAILVLALMLSACGGSAEPVEEAPEMRIPTPVHPPCQSETAACY